MEKDCRHVAPSDDSFTARMRFHQSWFRRHVLQLPPGPNPNSGNATFGNMLSPENGEQGWNFLTRAIHKVAEVRLSEKKGAIEPNRLKNNMLSSQPMCFNLFGPLCADAKLGTRLIRTLPGMQKIQEVTKVQVEYAPDKSKHLNDSTAFDAYVEYIGKDGTKGFVGIETKLTEPFSQKKYLFDPRYARWMEHRDWWWKDGVEDEFSRPLFNQLWRNHLLAFSILHQDEPAFSAGHCAVVYHDADGKCQKAMREYRKRMKASGDETLLDWSLSRILDAWEPVLEGREEKEWLKAFRLRYLDMDASEPEWNEYRQ